jgi:eukaryotic-like serine/threonine-protein kinase
MTPERWRDVQELLEKALAMAPSERSTYLNQACSSDPSLRQEVETLLAASANVRSSFLQSTPERAALTPGTKLDGYEVKSLLGSGGMGEVYRARDARLGRDVAIKVLPSFFSTDSDRLRRFEQEARAAAALNHPNILAVHQMGTYEGAPYLVSELLEGETLRDQIRRGRLSVRKAIDYGVQIARGLAAAHEKGIVHRDLKPENLFLTKDGRVKILDFGLAKLTQPQSSSPHSAVTLTEATEAGLVMGTVGYMSPEQVRGQTVDHRTDIFSFGAILYEMLAGKRAFQKPTSPETMTAILNEDPPAISQVVARIPSALQRVVDRCLEKSPDQRFQSASDLAFALEALEEQSGSAPAVNKKVGQKQSRAWAILAILAVGVAVAISLRFRYAFHHEPKHALVERHLTANLPESTISSFTISRDGKYLAYGDFSKKLYLLAIDTGEVRQLPLPAAYYPVDWFPDGNHLLLTIGEDGGDLWKMSIWDSSLRRIWGGFATRPVISPDGLHIAFLKDSHELWVMGADGEEPHKILASDSSDFYYAIAWSPTGLRLAYIRARRESFERHDATIETCDLSGASRKVLSEPNLWGYDGVSGITWLPDGRLVYSQMSPTNGANESDLWTAVVDANTGALTGEPIRLAGWKDSRAWSPQGSADGRRLIVGKQQTESRIYLGDLPSERKAFTPLRFTPDGWYNAVFDWTKDGNSILFVSLRNGQGTIFEQKLDTENPETLIAGPESYLSPQLSAEGTLLYTARSPSPPFVYRLMSTPEHGGPRSTLMEGLYGYACGSRPRSACVVAELKGKELTFSYLDPEKGKGEKIATLDRYAAAYPQWSLSPDGARIAIVNPSEFTGQVRILNRSDGTITVLPVRNWNYQELAAISWSADGKGLFASAQSSSSVALISINADGSYKIMEEMPQGAAWISGIVPSPDGKHLAFTKRVFARNVMLVENF